MEFVLWKLTVSFEFKLNDLNGLNGLKYLKSQEKWKSGK